jgi:hypothetical protein
VATVYSSADRSKFFLVPDGVKLRGGGMRVQAITGEQTRVDGEQILPYQVSEEEARKYVEERLAAIEALRRELVAFAEAVSAVGREFDREPPPERVSALLKAAGVSNLDMARDPTGSLKRVVKVVTEMSLESLQPLLKRSPT